MRGWLRSPHHSHHIFVLSVTLFLTIPIVHVRVISFIWHLIFTNTAIVWYSGNVVVHVHRGWDQLTLNFVSVVIIDQIAMVLEYFQGWLMAQCTCVTSISGCCDIKKPFYGATPWNMRAKWSTSVSGLLHLSGIPMQHRYCDQRGPDNWGCIACTCTFVVVCL